MPSNFPATFRIGAPSHFGLVANTRVFTSPFNGVTQTLELPGAHWHAQLTVMLGAAADLRALQAWLAGLRGAAGRLYLGDPYFIQVGPQGAAGGTPVVDGAAQTGTTLNTRGWPLSTAILKAGDYIHYDNADSERELKIVTADVSSDGAGDAALSIEPAIRVSPADAAAITVTGARGLFRLVDDRQAIVPYGRLGQGHVSLEFIEAYSSGA